MFDSKKQNARKGGLSYSSENSKIGLQCPSISFLENWKHSSWNLQELPELLIVDN
jgi:hypothetical protein